MNKAMVIAVLAMAAVLMIPAIAFAAAAKKPKVAAMALISRDIPAYTNDDCGGTKPASLANNNDYNTAWRGCLTPSADSPVWLAYDISGVPAKERAKTLLVWYNEETSPYDHTLITAAVNPGYNNIEGFTIDINNSAGGKLPETGWIPVVSIGGNKFHSRQFILNTSGYNWVRLTATAPDGTKDNMNVSVNMDLYDASKGTADDWIFIGDSITQMSMNHYTFECPLGKGSFSELVSAALPGYFPLQENGGTGYMQSTDGAAHIEEWVKMFPGKYVGLSYGTNDAWNGMRPEEYYNNYKIMVEAVLKAGKVPMVPTIPWSSTVEKIQTQGLLLNAEIAKLYRAYPKIVKGPDFWAYYKENPKMLSPDGVHPSNPDGLFAYRKLWAETALGDVYKAGN